MDVDRFFGIRFCICSGDFEVMWWESLAYLLGLWNGLFIGLVFVLAMGVAIDWILNMEVDFLGGVWIKQLPVARAVAGDFMLKLGVYKKVTTFIYTIFYMLYCDHDKGSEGGTSVLKRKVDNTFKKLFRLAIGMLEITDTRFLQHVRTVEHTTLRMEP